METSLLCLKGLEECSPFTSRRRKYLEIDAFDVDREHEVSYISEARRTFARWSCKCATTVTRLSCAISEQDEILIALVAYLAHEAQMLCRIVVCT